MITTRDMKFFDVARSMAKLSTWSEISREQIGAVIVLRNEIISTGYNRRKSSPSQAYWAKKAGRAEAIFAHAEISALEKIGGIIPRFRRDLHLAKIFVYRETSLGLGLAKPCEICTLAIKEFGIPHVYFTTDSGYGYEKFVENQ